MRNKSRSLRKQIEIGKEWSKVKTKFSGTYYIILSLPLKTASVSPASSNKKRVT